MHSQNGRRRVKVIVAVSKGGQDSPLVLNAGNGGVVYAPLTRLAVAIVKGDLQSRQDEATCSRVAYGVRHWLPRLQVACFFRNWKLRRTAQPEVAYYAPQLSSSPAR
jgi:hypothetical protein